MNNNSENWHDYAVDSRREIIALLRGIREKKQLVRLVLPGESDGCITSVLEVDPDSDTVFLDCSVDRAQNRRLAEASNVAFESSLDKIRILLDTETLAETTYEERPALRMDIPTSLIRLQRREFYRMETPLSNPVKVRMPAASGDPVYLLPLADISCGGIAILDNQNLLGDQIGVTFENCVIEVPDIGNVATSLQVRNQLEMTVLNGKINRRLGCQFVNLSRGGLAAVQKYITKLERERNARIAGLG